jgi:hypothetical protein
MQAGTEGLLARRAVSHNGELLGIDVYEHDRAATHFGRQYCIACIGTPKEALAAPMKTILVSGIGSSSEVGTTVAYASPWPRTR